METYKNGQKLAEIKDFLMEIITCGFHLFKLESEAVTAQ